MVGLDAIFRAVDISLQLRVAQITQRVDGADQFVELKDGLACAVMPRQGANFSHQYALAHLHR